MKTITDAATIAAEGYIQIIGVTIIDHGDTISIGHSEHAKHELDIDLENRRITSKISDWDVSW